MSDAHDLAHRHLAKVVESSDDAIVSKDLSSVIVSWNRAAERMFGYPAEEAIGRSIRMIIPADRQGEEDAVLAAIRAGRSVTHYETVRQRKDGSLIDISLTRLADLRRRGRDRRRLEDRPRHQRAGASAAAGARACRDHREAVRGGRRRRVVARPRHHRPEGHRHGAGADDGGLRRVLLQRPRRRRRRRLHALHAVGRAQGGLLDVPPSAGHRGVRAHLPRRGDHPARRRHGRPALRPEPAVSRHAAGAPAGAELSGRAGAGHAGRRARRAVLRQLPRRRVHRAAPADRRRHRRVGECRPRERPPARRGPRRQPHEGRVPRGAVARAADAAQRDRRLHEAAARRAAVRRQAGARPRNRGAQRQLADPDHRRRAGRVADRLGQDPPGRPAGAAARDRRQRRRDGAAGRRCQGRAHPDHPGSRASGRSRATPIACGRCCGTC